QPERASEIGLPPSLTAKRVRECSADRVEQTWPGDDPGSSTIAVAIAPDRALRQIEAQRNNLHGRDHEPKDHAGAPGSRTERKTRWNFPLGNRLRGSRRCDEHPGGASGALCTRGQKARGFVLELRISTKRRPGSPMGSRCETCPETR